MKRWRCIIYAAIGKLRGTPSSIPTREPPPVSGTATTHGHNGNNPLTKTARPTAGRGDYGYDAQGRRVTSPEGRYYSDG